MKKLGILIRKSIDDVIAIACSLILFTSIACAGFGEPIKSKRFDFAEHTQEFIEGKELNIKCLLDEGEPVKHWIIHFKDGCTVRFITDLDDSHSRCWRWDNHKGHGKQV